MYVEWQEAEEIKDGKDDNSGDMKKGDGKSDKKDEKTKKNAKVRLRNQQVWNSVKGPAVRCNGESQRSNA